MGGQAGLETLLCAAIQLISADLVVAPQMQLTDWFALVEPEDKPTPGSLKPSTAPPPPP